MLDFLSSEEVNLSKIALEELSKVSWASLLIANFKNNGGFKKENKPFLFEIRYAYELLKTDVSPTYERKTLKDSTVDFYFEDNSFNWYIELVSITNSNAINEGIKFDGIYQELILHPHNPNQKLTQQGEIIKVQEKILAKVINQKNQAIKFLNPEKNTINMLVVDMRGFCGLALADKHDYMEITTGHHCIPDVFRHYWYDEKSQTHKPIIGLFEKTNNARGVKELHNKIHLIGFVCETDYIENEIKNKIFYVYNHHLLTEVDAKKIIDCHPFHNINSGAKHGDEE